MNTKEFGTKDTPGLTRGQSASARGMRDGLLGSFQGCRRPFLGRQQSIDSKIHNANSTKGTLLLVLKSSPHDFSVFNKSIHSREAFCPAFALCRTCEFLLARPTGLKTKRGILWFQQCVALGVHSG